MSHRWGPSGQALKKKWGPNFALDFSYWPEWGHTGHPTKPRTELPNNSDPWDRDF